MKIDFQAIEETRIPNFKGGEGVMVAKMYVDDTVRILKAYLEKDSSIGMHRHEGSSETIYILSGEGKVLFEDTEEVLQAGDCHYCPEGKQHSLVNTGDEPLHFVAVVPNV